MRSAKAKPRRDRSARSRGSPSAPAPTAPGRRAACWASRNPHQPASRGWAANSSARVGLVRDAGRRAALRSAPRRPTVASPAAGERRSPSDADSAAGDEGQGSRHTTHNDFVLFCSCSATRRPESMGQLGGLRFRPGNRAISAHRRARRPASTRRSMWLQSSSTAWSRSPRCPRADGGATIPSRARPQSQRRHRRLVRRCRGIGGSSTGWPATRSYSRQTLLYWRRSPEKGEPSVTTARTRSGSRPRQLARVEPAEAPADQQHRRGRRRPRRAARFSRSSVSARAPRLSPAASRGPESPPRRARGASSIVVRSLARKPGMTSAGGPSAGPRGPRWPKVRDRRARPAHATSRSRGASPRGRRTLGAHASRDSRRPSAPAAPRAASPGRPRSGGSRAAARGSAGDASAVLLSVCANRTLPSSPR